jgi:hypothetical protein
MKNELKELKDLLDEGLITQEDYDKKKNDLLSNNNNLKNPNDILKTDLGERFRKGQNYGNIALLWLFIGVPIILIIITKIMR